MKEGIETGLWVLENEKYVPGEAEENMDRLGYNRERLLDAIQFRNCPLRKGSAKHYSRHSVHARV